MIDCMTCLVSTSWPTAGSGLDIISEGITHSVYHDPWGDECQTCRHDKIKFRTFWYDAVIRAMRGLKPRPIVQPPRWRMQTWRWRG